MTVAFANSAGHRAPGRYSRAILDGIQQTPDSSGSGHAAGVSLDDLDAAATGALAGSRARDGAVTFDTKPGEYEVVLAPSAWRRSPSSSRCTASTPRQRSKVSRSPALGSPVRSADDLVDDVTDRRALGVAFDSEGTPKQRLALIDAGVTSALAHDRRTARKAGTVSTGHATPGSDVWGPIAHTLFLREGPTAVDEMIAAVERGIYVATFNYCRVLDPKSLVVTGLTRNGTFMIENGEITGAVSNLRFTQSFVAALGPGNVLGIGDDARFGDSEFGPGMAHVPSCGSARGTSPAGPTADALARPAPSDCRVCRPGRRRRCLGASAGVRDPGERHHRPRRSRSGRDHPGVGGP